LYACFYGDYASCKNSNDRDDSDDSDSTSYNDTDEFDTSYLEDLNCDCAATLMFCIYETGLCDSSDFSAVVSLCEDNCPTSCSTNAQTNADTYSNTTSENVYTYTYDYTYSETSNQSILTFSLFLVFISIITLF